MMTTLLEFTRAALRVEGPCLTRDDIEGIVRIRGNSGNRTYAEVLVTFRRIADRDYVASKGRNLASFIDDEGKPTAGLKMDIPPFLMPTFRLLQNTSRTVKRAHGPECRVYTKFDDDGCDLYLDIKTARESHWFSITANQAKEMVRDRENDDFRALKQSIADANLSNPNMIPIGQRAPPSASQSSATSSWIPPREPTVPPHPGAPPHRWDPLALSRCPRLCQTLLGPRQPELNVNHYHLGGSHHRRPHRKQAAILNNHLLMKLVAQPHDPHHIGNNRLSINDDFRTSKPFNFAVTNARSIAPKREKDLTFAVITESWLTQDDQSEETLLRLKTDGGIATINHYRRKGRHQRNPGGGVTIAFNQTKINLTE